jgi:hypothetical protein
VASLLASGTVATADTPAGVATSAVVRPTIGPHPGVVIEVDACPALDEAALRQLVVIEIGDLLLPPQSKARSAAQERMTIHCEGERIHLLVTAAAGAAPIERTLKTGDFPGDAAPRALALAGIEMLAALSPTVRQRVDARQGIMSPSAAKSATPASPAAPARPGAPAPTSAPGAASADEVATEESVNADAEAAAAAPPTSDAKSAPASATSEEVAGAASRAELLISVAAVRRAFFGRGGVAAWGANVGLDRELGARWLYRLELEGDATTRATPVGNVNVLLASSGGFLGVRFGRPDLTAMLAAGGRLGLVRFAGASSAGGVQASSVIRAWGGPAVAARLLSGGGRLGLSLSLEGGIALIASQATSDLSSTGSLNSIAGPGQSTTVVAAGGLWVVAGAGIWF